MTYNKIYNQLEKNGLIEKILLNSEFDKIGVIKGIEYLEGFLNTHTFNDMKYFKHPDGNKTIVIVCLEYAKLQIENNKKYIDKFEYMIKSMS